MPGRPARARAARVAAAGRDRRARRAALTGPCTTCAKRRCGWGRSSSRCSGRRARGAARRGGVRERRVPAVLGRALACGVGAGRRAAGRPRRAAGRRARLRPRRAVARRGAPRGATSIATDWAADAIDAAARRTPSETASRSRPRRLGTGASRGTRSSISRSRPTSSTSSRNVEPRRRRPARLAPERRLVGLAGSGRTSSSSFAAVERLGPRSPPRVVRVASPDVDFRACSEAF